MKLTVSHRITTRFSPARRRLLQNLRVFPSSCGSQTIERWEVTTEGGVIGSHFTDGAGDATATLSCPGEVEEVTLEISGEVSTFDTLGVLRDLKERVPPMAYLTPTRLSRADSAITQMAREAIGSLDESAGLDRAHALAKAVTEALTETREPSVEMSTAAEVLESGEGGAGDFAHVLIAAAQSMQMPARFVYGYYMRNSAQLSHQSDGDTAQGPLISTIWPAHAWAELWIEGMGWVGFDAVAECCPDEAYVRLCSGRDGADAAPLRGVALGGGAEACDVALDVQAAEQ